MVKKKKKEKKKPLLFHIQKKMIIRLQIKLNITRSTKHSLEKNRNVYLIKKQKQMKESFPKEKIISNLLNESIFNLNEIIYY